MGDIEDTIEETDQEVFGSFHKHFDSLDIEAKAVGYKIRMAME